MMKYFLSISLSLTILLQGIGLTFQSILEVGDLLEHYRFHEETYGDDFISFLSKHYGELKQDHNQKHQEEHQDHEKLPFEHPCQSTALTIYLPVSSANLIDHWGYALESQSQFRYLDSYSFFLEDGPFQPPKTV